MNKRRLTAAAALAAALTLSACGTDTAASQTAAPGTANTSSTHGGGHSGTSSAPAAPADALGNAADISFLAGMKPHHQQAVEMSDMVLAADPPEPVAEVARQIKAAQAPEIEQMDMMLKDLGQATDGAGHGGAHSAGAGHGGMMSDVDMAALMDAEGTDAARRYLEGMIAHHKGAIEAAEAELRDGRYEPARQLATSIAKDQAAQITKMEGLLTRL